MPEKDIDPRERRHGLCGAERRWWPRRVSGEVRGDSCLYSRRVVASHKQAPRDQYRFGLLG